jgi:secreted Zn-dependent insulinase-like peptidase
MLFSQPYSHCITGSGICLEDPKYYYLEKHAALSEASLAEFHAFCSILIRNMSAEVFVHGNAVEEEAKKIAADVMSITGSKGISLSLEPCRRYYYYHYYNQQ